MTTKRTRKSGTHRAVSAKKQRKDISEEPEMKKLKSLFNQMPDTEKARTIDHLKKKGTRMGCLKCGRDMQLEISPEDLDRLRRFIAHHQWIYARAQPQWPHFYTLRRFANEEDFLWFVIYIREHGYDERFGKSSTYIRLAIDGWKYWSMGDRLENTILINRAKLT